MTYKSIIHDMIQGKCEKALETAIGSYVICNSVEMDQATKKRHVLGIHSNIKGNRHA